MRTYDDFFVLTPAKVCTAVERIVASCQPRTILVFGSRARGSARPDSDLDLLIVLTDPVPEATPWRSLLRAVLADMAFAKDILVSDPEHLARWRDHPNSVYATALSEGVVLWQDGKLDDDAVKAICCHR